MKRIGIVIVAVAFFVSCETTQPVWFIATPGYVDAQIAMHEEALRADYEARIAELETELAEQKKVAEELSSLSGVIREVDASNKELQTLAARVEDEVKGLPESTIRMIIDALTNALTSTE